MYNNLQHILISSFDPNIAGGKSKQLSAFAFLLIVLYGLINYLHLFHYTLQLITRKIIMTILHTVQVKHKKRAYIVQLSILYKHQAMCATAKSNNNDIVTAKALKFPVPIINVNSRLATC